MKITGYGPWTLTLGSDREHELQMLQASLYQKLQKLFSEKNGLVFQNRSDEFFDILIDVEVSNIKQLVTIIAPLRALSEVKSVERI